MVWIRKKKGILQYLAKGEKKEEAVRNLRKSPTEFKKEVEHALAKELMMRGLTEEEATKYAIYGAVKWPNIYERFNDQSAEEAFNALAGRLVKLRDARKTLGMEKERVGDRHEMPEPPVFENQSHKRKRIKKQQ